MRLFRPATVSSSARQRLPVRGEGGARRSRGKWMLVGVVPLVIVAVWGLWNLKPRAITCRTTDHTRCPEALEQAVQGLSRISWWQQRAQWEELEARLSQPPSDVVAIQWRRTLQLTVEVEVERAETLGVVQWDGQWWRLRSNGTLAATDLVPPLALVFASDSVQNSVLSNEWRDPARLAALQALFTSATRSSPPLKRLELISPQEVRATSDHGDTIVLSAESAEEVKRQMSTLQALFRSSTMEKEFTGRTIDVRFREVIVK